MAVYPKPALELLCPKSQVPYEWVLGHCGKAGSQAPKVHTSEPQILLHGFPGKWSRNNELHLHVVGHFRVWGLVGFRGNGYRNNIQRVPKGRPQIPDRSRALLAGCPTATYQAASGCPGSGCQLTGFGGLGLRHEGFGSGDYSPP